MLKNIAVKYFVSLPIFFVSFLFPRSKKIWVFTGWHRTTDGEIFADNTKYLFLETSNNTPTKAVWLAKNTHLAELLRNNGYTSYYEHSLKGIWYALRAGYTFIDAYMERQNTQYTGRTKIIQLLHGKGMKKNGYGKKISREYSYIFGSSDFTVSLLPKTFTQSSSIAVTGYSRNDVFYKQIPGSEIGVDLTLLEKLKSSGENQVLYSPTFRREITKSEISSIIDFKQLDDLLLKVDCKMFISLHPKLKTLFDDSAFKNICFIKNSDIYPLLPYFDALITDYSSIFADFLLLNKPMIFFPHDLEHYEKHEGLILPYTEIVPGPIVRSVTELVSVIESEVANPKQYEALRSEIKKRYHSYHDGESSKRIIQNIISD